MAYVGGGYDKTLLPLVAGAGYTTARSINRGIVQTVDRRYRLRVVRVGGNDDVIDPQKQTLVPGCRHSRPGCAASATSNGWHHGGPESHARPPDVDRVHAGGGGHMTVGRRPIALAAVLVLVGVGCTTPSSSSPEPSTTVAPDTSASPAIASVAPTIEPTPSAPVLTPDPSPAPTAPAGLARIAKTERDGIHVRIELERNPLPAGERSWVRTAGDEPRR